MVEMTGGIIVYSFSILMIISDQLSKNEMPQFGCGNMDAAFFFHLARTGAECVK